VLEFLDASDDWYLMYNICGWNPYEINMFLVETDRPAVKPRLLTFKVLEPVYDPDPELGDVIKAPLEERIRVTLEQQKKVEYEARSRGLLPAWRTCLGQPNDNSIENNRLQRQVGQPACRQTGARRSYEGPQRVNLIRVKQPQEENRKDDCGPSRPSVR